MICTIVASKKLCFVSVLVFYNKFINHGSRRGNAMQTLTRWRPLVASFKARDMLRQAMHPASHRPIRMAIKSPAFDVYFFVLDFVVAHNHS